jgi:hypothetical protein
MVQSNPQHCERKNGEIKPSVYHQIMIGFPNTTSFFWSWSHELYVIDLAGFGWSQIKS